MMPLLFTSLFASGGVVSPVVPGAIYAEDDITGTEGSNQYYTNDSVSFIGYTLSHTGKIVGFRLRYISVASGGTDIKFGIYRHDVNMLQPTLLLGSGVNFIPPDGSPGVIELPFDPSEYVPVVSGQIVWLATLFNNGTRVLAPLFDPANTVARRAANSSPTYADGLPEVVGFLQTPFDHAEKRGVKIWTNAPVDPPPVDPAYEYSGENGTLHAFAASMSEDSAFTQRYFAGFAGKVVGARLYVDTVTYPNGVTVNGYLGFYSDNAGAPGTLLAQIAITIPDLTAASWMEWTLDPGDYIDVAATDALHVAYIFDSFFDLPRANSNKLALQGGWTSYPVAWGGTEEYSDGLDTPFDTVLGEPGWPGVVSAMKIWTNP